MQLRRRSLRCSVWNGKKTEMEACSSSAVGHGEEGVAAVRGKRPPRGGGPRFPPAWLVPVPSWERRHVPFPFSSPLMLPEPLFKSNYWNCSMPCLFTTGVTCHSGFQLSSPPPVNPRFRTQKRRQMKQQTVYCPQWR